MALADHAPSDARLPSGMPCSVQELINNLDEADQEELNAWLFGLGYSQEAIYRAIKAAGHEVGKQTINRHRSRSCRCFR